MIKKSYIYLILWIPVAFACQLEPLPEDMMPGFNKLYAVSENVEAIDFICKPDQSGYLILANIKTDDDSDIALINVNASGMQTDFHRITNADFYDEGVKMKLLGQEGVLVLTHRKTSAQQENPAMNMLIKADLDGLPVDVNQADSVAAEFKILQMNTSSEIIAFKDFLVIPNYLICVGSIRNSPTSNTSKVTEIFELSDIDFNQSSTEEIEKIQQKPAVLNYSGSYNLKILPGNNPDEVYAVIGQEINENPQETVQGPSLNIIWEIYTDLVSTAPARPSLGTDENDRFADYLRHSTNEKDYFLGNYNEANNDSVFLIRKEYINSQKEKSQQIFKYRRDTTNVSDVGRTTAASLAEDSDGNIVVATIEEKELSTYSYLQKFSQEGEALLNENIEFQSTGFYKIKKIECEPNNVVVILSQKEFENNSTAIGLMKIKF
ncbi:hypothetical protein MATR_14990 [Marivirga tractuosa]|uniref:Lipoprotein n=1 Tax=Marivirga tractuosa (strain ATCC 23168 / DSM 4126 / NBRC 15989 / NCIMB 1408 / VKM B-1430 / H-43) TaxID=643867 RepID=E4TT27_MARTH|nr:hypothetical protein [Marivirga tractuosa]ADR20875.1 hypothetical protein Ftrac_0873 [Marivirga tractuosa DSM 4126]BDD14674.1 hypothetical protein MATR_14990 [Marivirga tractuosa]